MPQLAVMVGLLLALCSIAVFIYFIHHVPQSIHINHVVAEVGRQLLRAIDRHFPDLIHDSPLGERKREEEAALPDDVAGLTQIRSHQTGYIQAVDEGRMIEAAREEDVLLVLKRQAGDYVHAGRVIAEAGPVGQVGEKTLGAVRAGYILGTKRSLSGDLLFLVDELVEIAGRALSTGINDPFTAMTCLDWLGAGASEVARRRIPSRRRRDDRGDVRLVAMPISFGAFVERGFGGMRQYVARDMSAAVHAINTLMEVARDTESTEAVEILRKELAKLKSLYQEELTGAGLACVEEQAAAAERLFQARLTK